ncbi:4-(cytidine 5'-diphospho)-2-C-methyl-D-erythritol kinase [Colwellia sp. Arc7-635]|uniref:4-(cytidine 5'-diphospho)-2-C-methyl-D-erythritol kinase n=1 Tax=Colwellia sp. Arc7-635 TaxID=2497879 RepID=UPI000F8512A5|nr:4-(cytidine 5'-diphospho)-2-C-methyl-D-erythritol kinase [Colwellia sp. Arc7-635]AZQ83503.1 4-(cytidine 5'-diphospho)-2-C-methyl-D-erythritol kinase [Colwellia sp. Arc7-635]
MNQQPFLSFPSPAKLNLFLHIIGRMENGYHQLETVFQFLDYHDTLELSVTTDKAITLLTPIPGVENDDNLIVKAARLLQQHTQCQQGVDIKLKKLLPMGGGLGGGSSNAATILLALNALWKTQLSTEELAELGIKLGADVPIFIHGFSAFAQGIGEQLTPATPKTYWYLVSKPNCSISTQSVFTAKDLTRDTPAIRYSDKNIENYHNDCQTWVIKHYPEVAKLLAWLIEYAPSQMTGTGACIFSRFSSKQDACYVQSLLPSGIESFVAEGLNQSPLHAAVAAVNDN